jgi:hypothetical protein
MVCARTAGPELGHFFDITPVRGLGLPRSGMLRLRRQGLNLYISELALECVHAVILPERLVLTFMTLVTWPWVFRIWVPFTAHLDGAPKPP